MFCDQGLNVSQFWNKVPPGSDPGGFHHGLIHLRPQTETPQNKTEWYSLSSQCLSSTTKH